MKNFIRGIPLPVFALGLVFSSPALLAQGLVEKATSEEPLSPEYLKWLESQKVRAERIKLGLQVEPLDPRLGTVPAPFSIPPPDLPMTQKEAMVRAGLDKYSATYDLRPLGLTGAVRDQGIYNACWAFSAIAVVESSLRKQGMFPGDLSEAHLMYYANTPLNGFPSYDRTRTTNVPYDQGGHYGNARGLFTRGNLAGAPVSAAIAPYSIVPAGIPPADAPSTVTITKSFAFTPATPPTPANVETIKGMLETYGEVSIAYFTNGGNSADDAFINRTTKAWRNTGSQTENHTVSIVGWNDNYPKENFPAGNQPASNGAWIVRNTWGASNATTENGYFYMAYDSTIRQVAKHVARAGIDTKTYQYNMFDYINRFGWNTASIWYANVFTADSHHDIKAVGFYVSGSNMSYRVEIRKISGQTVSQATINSATIVTSQEGQTDFEGYYRVELNTPVYVAPDDKFAVVLRVNAPSGGYAYAPFTRNSPDQRISTATAQAGWGWATSSGTGWANVAADGYATATGSLFIKAFAEPAANVPVSSLALNKSASDLGVGATEQLTATVLPNEATNKGVSWSTSNAAVATVSSTGLVRGVSAGTATITATSAGDGTKTATCVFTVTSVPVTGLTLNKATATIAVGSTEALTATLAPSNATNKGVSWSTSNAAVATVSNTGVVTGVSAGAATITAASADDPTKTATCAVTVTTVAVTGLELNKPSTILQVGHTEALHATVNPSNATNKGVSWSSNNTAVATVSSTGVVTGVSAGAATITAASAADPTKTAACQVTVSAASVVTISIAPFTVSLATGRTQQFTATVEGSSNTAVTWSIDVGHGSITQSGLYTAPATPCTCHVTATSVADPTKSDTAVVTVTQAQAVSVSVSPRTVSLLPSHTQQFTAAVTGAANAAVTWSVQSGQGSITQGGLYTAPAAAGTYAVTATSQADPTKTDTATVTVSGGVEFTSVPKALFVNDTATLRATAVGPADAAVTFQASHGTVLAQTGASATYQAPAAAPPESLATITATSVAAPALSGQARIVVRALEFVKFGNDNNLKTRPMLLDFANAYGSASKADLDKYDVNGDGVIDDEDLLMALSGMMR